MNESRSLDEPLLELYARNGIATLTLNSPLNFNVLSSAMIGALQAALDDLATRREVRVVILAANGRAFCAGHDLREMRAHDDETWQRTLFERCSKMMATIATMPQPIIAKVHGIATAAGCQLVASCDLAVASRDAKFATSGINLGLFCSTPAVALTRIVAPKHTAEMLFTGDFFDAEHACRIGLINRAVHHEQLDDETFALAQRIASHSGAALASGKRLLKQLRHASAEQILADYSLAATNMSHDMTSADAKVGIDAFLHKSERAPWSHR